MFRAIPFQSRYVFETKCIANIFAEFWHWHFVNTVWATVLTFCFTL